MEMGNGVTPQWLSESRVGANRMPLRKRMLEEANAWGNAQDRLTSSRCSERESGESEAMRQNPGTIPEGGLARHPMEESPTACLPPPKTDRSYRIPGSWHVRMSYTDDISVPNP